MKEGLQQILKQVIEGMARQSDVSLPPDFEIELVVSKDPAHGDFASNVALKLSKTFKRRPAEIAKEIAGALEGQKSTRSSAGIEKVEIAGPGFINFHLAKASLSRILVTIFEENDRYGASEYGKDKQVMLEFVSANPTGPLTVAHGRQAAVGDSLARILRMTGHTVMNEYYLNDAGRQMNLLGESLFARYKEALGHPLELPEEGYQGEYLKHIGRELVDLQKDKLLKETPEKQQNFCRKFAAQKLMEEIRQDLQDFGVSFDNYFSEQSLYQKDEINKTFADLEQKGYLYESEGALWFRSTDFGDDKDRVVRKSSGDFTYLAPDIAYHRSKFEREFNWVIDLLGPDHHGYTARLKAACQALGHDASQIEVLIVQLVTLFRQGEPVRMSTRAGEFVTLRELIEEVGRDAARFFFIMRRVESHLDFDLDLAKAKTQDNPVYYLQYAHARIASILRFSKTEVSAEVDVSLLKSAEERELIKKLSELPDILIRAGELLEPYRLADYLREIAASFHKFYQYHRVVSDDEPLTGARLLLCDATRIVLRNGLDTLGISQPESM